MRVIEIDAAAMLAALTQREAAVLESILDTRTGALFQLFDPMVSGQDNEPVESAMDQEPDRYAVIPMFDREFRLMNAWAEQVEDEALGNALFGALRGQGAFRAFTAVLDGDPQASATWTRYRHDALVDWAEAWLHTLGLTPKWIGMPAVPSMERREPAPQGRTWLLHVLALGVGGPPDATGLLRRTVAATSASEARSWFKMMARELCELRGEPWSARYVRSTDAFERAGIRLRHDAERVHLVFQLDEGIRARLLAVTATPRGQDS